MPPEIVAILGLFTAICLAVGLAMVGQTLIDWILASPCPKCGSNWSEMVSGKRIDGKELWLCRTCCYGWSVYRTRR